MEHLKPKLHLFAQENWMNDPNAPMFYKGYYHLFFQCNPSQPNWGNIHWGHARSRDLIHWEHLPHALTPSWEKGEYHCFSGGGILLPGKRPVIFYTSIHREHPVSSYPSEQWAAYALDDDLIHWEKDANNPIITDALHEGRGEIKEWRDPYLFRINDETVGLVMGGSVQNQGAVMLYTSQDLRMWEYQRVLFQDPQSRFIECPNFFPLEDRHVLLFSPDQTVEACVGSFDPVTFEFSVMQREVVDFGKKENFYATNTFQDAQGNWLMYAWVSEGARKDIPTSWAGMQSFPRRLSLSKEGPLQFHFADQLYQMVGDIPFSTLKENQIIEKSICGFLRLKFSSQSCFELVLFSNEKNEETVIKKTTQSIIIDRSKSSASRRHQDSPLIADVPKSRGEHEVEILWDGSIVEIIYNHRICLSARVYPENLSGNMVFVRSKNAGFLAFACRKL